MKAAHSPENGSTQCVDSSIKPLSALDTNGSASDEHHDECHRVEVAPDESDCKEAEDPRKVLAADAADETDTETEDEGDFWVAVASRPVSFVESTKADETEKEENGASAMRHRSSSVTMRKLSDVAAELKNVLVGGAQDFVKDSYELAVGFKEGMEITVEDTISLKAKLVNSTQATLAANYIGMLSGRNGRNSLSSSPERPAISNLTADEVVKGSSRPSVNPLEALSKGLRANLGLQEQQDTEVALATASQEGSVETVQPQRVAPSLDDQAETNDAMDQMRQSTGSSSSSPPTSPTDALERLLSGDDVCESEETPPEAPRASARLRAQSASTSVAKAASASVAKVGQFARSLARLAPQRRAASSQVSSPTSRDQRPEETSEDLEESSTSCLNTTEAAEEDSPTRRNSNTAVLGALKASQKMALATQAMSSGLLRQASGLGGKLAAATRSRSKEKAKDETRGCSIDSRHSNSDVEDSIFAICSDEDDDMFTDEVFQTEPEITNGKSEASDEKTEIPQQSRRHPKSPKTADADAGHSESEYYEKDAEEEERVIDEEVDPADDDAIEKDVQHKLDPETLIKDP